MSEIKPAELHLDAPAITRGDIENPNDLGFAVLEAVKKISPANSDINVHTVTAAGRTEKGDSLGNHGLGVIIHTSKGFVVAVKKGEGTFAVESFPRTKGQEATEWLMREASPFMVEKSMEAAKRRKRNWIWSAIAGVMLGLALSWIFEFGFWAP